MSDPNPFEEFRSKSANPFAEFAPAAAPAMSTGDVAADVAKSGGIGLVKGGIGVAGMAGDLSNALAKGSQVASDYIAGKLGIDPGPRAAETMLPTAASLQKHVEDVTGDFYKPKTVAGEYAQTAGEFAPAVVGGGPESLAAKLVSRVAVPAVASETAGRLPGIQGTAAEPYVRAGAAMLSPGAVGRVIAPNPVSPARQALLDTLHNEGVTSITAGQGTGNDSLKYAETFFGDAPMAGHQAQNAMRQGEEQFTAAALRRAGETANHATPEVVDNAFNRIGNDFNGVGSRNNVLQDHHLWHDLASVEGEYNGLVGPSQRAPVVRDTIQDINDMVANNGGHLTGDQYNAITSRLARQARGAKADPQLQEALSGTRAALDDAMERTLQAGTQRTITTTNPVTGTVNHTVIQGPPNPDLEILRTARRQYRNLMVIEKAATGAGAATAEGIISPAQLRNATVNQNRRDYARGRGDFADLARAGSAIMRPLPNSGTAHRNALLNIANTLTAGVVPAVAGRAIMSRPVQAYLGNQIPGQAYLGNLLRPAGGGRAVDAVAAALLAHQGHPEPTPKRLYVSPGAKFPNVVKALQDQQP